MTIATTAQPAATTYPTPGVAWTCPFCPLLCDSFQVAPAPIGGGLELVGSDCPRAAAALSRCSAVPAVCQPQVGGRPCDPDDALAAAARLLVASRQPLFGGLGTDVAGGRALYRLACETGAIADAAHGSALQHALSALQDKGGYTTTLAEVRTRADLIVCVGGLPSVDYPEFFRRCGVGESQVPLRRIVVIGEPGELHEAGEPRADGRGADARADGGIVVEWLPPADDLFATLARLAARVDGRLPATPSVSTAPIGALRPVEAAAGRAAWADADATAGRLDELAQALHDAVYAVIVWQSPRLPAHGALLIEAVDRIVAVLNRRGRAAAFSLGGGAGGATVNQVFGWLSGLPLRSRAGPLGLEHEPLVFDSARLLADGAVDSLLWVASYGTEPAPPVSALPTVVLGHPACAGIGARAAGSVFIPVSTPGIGSAGHLFRTDGAVLMPLSPVYADSLPTVAEVAGRLTRAVQALRVDSGGMAGDATAAAAAVPA